MHPEQGIAISPIRVKKTHEIIRGGLDRSPNVYRVIEGGGHVIAHRLKIRFTVLLIKIHIRFS